jgi:hypothetical protein
LQAIVYPKHGTPWHFPATTGSPPAKTGTNGLSSFALFFLFLLILRRLFRVFFHAPGNTIYFI